MQQQQDNAPQTYGAEARERPQNGVRSRKRDPAGLWRAIAGMAMTVALACAIVMLEFTSRAMRRADRMHRRAAALFERVTHLKSDMATQRAQAAADHQNLVAAQSLLAILHAPDATMVPLVPVLSPSSKTSSPLKASSIPVSRVARSAGTAPSRTDNSADGTSHGGAPRRPTATLVLAAREGRAVLIVAGLAPPRADANFALWWSATGDNAHHAPMRAAEFRTATDGGAVVAAVLSADALSADAMAVTVTLEQSDTHRARSLAAGAARADAARAPSGPILLRGTFRR